MRHVWNRSQNLMKPFVVIRDRFLSSLDFFAQFFGLSYLGGRVLLVLLESGDLLGGAVPLRLHRFRFSDRLAPLRVDSTKIFQNFGRLHTALAQFFFYKRQVVSDKV